MGELTTAATAPDPRAVGEAVRAALPHGTVQGMEVERGAELVLRVRSDGLLDVLALLRDAQRFAFEQLMDICGVDFPERAERFEVVYNLLSLSRNQRIRVVTEVAAGGSVPSVAGLWPCATWYEREAWDMFGIVFDGQTA